MDESGRHCMELRGSVRHAVSLRTLYSIESSDPERVSVVVVNA